VVAVEAVADQSPPVDLVDDVVGVLLGRSGEDGEFVVLGQVLEELRSEGTDVVGLSGGIEVDERLVQVQDEVVRVLRVRSGQEGTRGHLEHLPLEIFIDLADILQGMSGNFLVEYAEEEVGVGEGLGFAPRYTSRYRLMS
jgi:hypothetical protein